MIEKVFVRAQSNDLTWLDYGFVPFYFCNSPIGNGFLGNKVNGGIRFDIMRLNQWLDKRPTAVRQPNYN